MNKEFSQAFGALNDQQKQAVDALDGPVLVIAGPGTGKTQLLSTRVANILAKTDAQAANILCLTFTNKAAGNMRDRIMQLVGPEGNKVAVKTFHSFAGEIMNIYPDHFWNAAALSVAPESVQLDVVEGIVSQLPLDNPLALKFAGQFTLLKDVQRAINLTKDAGLTPDKLRAIITANLAYIDVVEPLLVDVLDARLSAKGLAELSAKIAALPKQDIDAAVYPLTSLSTVITDSLATAIEQDADTGKTVNTGAWKQRWVQTVEGKKAMFKERERNAWWLALADVYEAYRTAIHERGFYDYADMLVEVIAQLEQTPSMLADVQERFSYVLIDEFQDTNPAQLRLAHLVADHHSALGTPNLMAVGDDDQSIFKFNGAELNNMLGFRRAYPSAKIIVLTKNYRSTQTVLDAAASIIDQAETRLVNVDKSLDKRLLAADPPKGLTSFSASSYASRELQLSMVARDVAKIYKPTQSIAVLARSHDSLIKMASLLQSLNVPVRYEQATNVLEHELVNQLQLLIGLLLAIQNGDKDQINALTHQTIRLPAWGVPADVLWAIATANYTKADWLGSLLNSKDKNLNSIGNWLLHMAKQATDQPLAITVEQLIGLRSTGGYTSPLSDYYSSNKTGDLNKYLHGLSAIQLLRALVHEFAATNEPKLEDLARFIELNKTNGVVVADESPFITGEGGVQLLTVHKAKGLEFDQVYIIDAIADNWQPRPGKRKPPANLPLQPVGEDADDYIRLMYVAVTRARSVVKISGYYQDHAGKDVAITPIIASVFDVKQITESDPKQLISVLQENLRWPSLAGGQEKQMLQAVLEGYQLNVTHLLNFLDVARGGPQYFKERNLLRLPEAKTIVLSYGTAMHAALEAAQLQTNAGKFSLTKVQDVFSKALAAEQVGRAEYGRFNPKGRQTLQRVFKDFNYQLPKGSLPEQKIKDIRLGSAVISGKLDRVDSSGGVLSIIDYKTGSPLASFFTKNKAVALKAYRHKMQLIFYALLATEQPSLNKGKTIEGQMVYVEAPTAKELVRNYQPTTQDIARMRQLVEVVWKKIINLDLPDTSAYSPDIDGVLKFEQDLIEGK